MQPSDNPVRAKFAEHAFHALGRIEGTPTPRGWLAYATTSTTSGRRTPTPPLSRMFAGEQRAIGELMIREGPRPLECMGYAEFLRKSGPKKTSCSTRSVPSSGGWATSCSRLARAWPPFSTS